VNYGRKSSEVANVKFRRSIYIVKDIKAGDPLSNNNIRVIRPGFGLAPKHLESILGKEVQCNLVRGTALTWDHIK